MDRREAVKYISLLMGGTVVGGTAFLTGCKSDTAKPQNWDASEIAYLDEIGRPSYRKPLLQEPKPLRWVSL